MAHMRIYGRVEEIALGRRNEREILKVWLKEYSGRYFFTHLDEGATLALAQLSLLRQAVADDLEVRLKIDWLVSTDVYDDDGNEFSSQSLPSAFYEVKIYERFALAKSGVRGEAPRPPNEERDRGRGPHNCGVSRVQPRDAIPGWT